MTHTPENHESTRAATLAALKKSEERRARTTKLATWGGAATLVVAIGVGTAVGLSSTEKIDQQQAPKAATAGLALPVGDADAPITLDIYEDFQCPACGQFEKLYGSTLASAVDAGDVRVNYHMMAFLGEESVRASAAGACAADAGKFKDFHTWAYANQPTEHTGGFTTDDLLAAGTTLGLGDGYAQCVTDGTYDSYGPKVDAAAAKKGVTGTPTTFVDGVKTDPGRVIDAINASLNESSESTILPAPDETTKQD